METVDKVQLKSPTKKLVVFFQCSRDKWKQKYFAKRDHNILLANKVRAVEKSRKHWRELAEQAQQKAKQAQEEIHQLREQLKKTEIPNQGN